MMFWKKAQKIIDVISDIDMTPSDIDGIAYSVVHGSPVQVWERAKVLGESLTYHADMMYTRTHNNEGEQLWLPFDKQ